MWSPGLEGRILTENLFVDSAPAYTAKPPSGVGGIPVSGGLATIFARLEFAGLLNLQHFAAKRSHYASC
jgi:hypothetical protein